MTFLCMDIDNLTPRLDFMPDFAPNLSTSNISWIFIFRFLAKKLFLSFFHCIQLPLSETERKQSFLYAGAKNH